MTVGDYIKHYNDHYLRHGLAGSGQRLWEHKRAMWVSCGFTDDMSILDYGCGVGAVIPGVPDVTNYLGVDISAEAIRLARQEHPGVSFAVFEPGHLDVSPADMVVAHSVFTHCPQRMVNASLKDVYRHMNQFGIVDVIYGEDNPDNLHVTQWLREDWEALLDIRGFTFEWLQAIANPASNYTHQYYRIAKR